MSRIAERAEAALHHRELFFKQRLAQQASITEAISQAVASSALDLDAKAIISSTQSGYTARMVSKYRPKAPIIAATPSEQVMRGLSLTWGVTPVKVDQATSTDEMFDVAVAGGVKTGIVAEGDLVVITAGVPTSCAGSTNLVKVSQIGQGRC